MIGPSSQISKILLTLLFLLIIFYVFMDIELYLRIQNYAIERNYHLNATTTAAAAGSSMKPTLAAVGSATLTTIGTTAQLLPPTHSAAVGVGVAAAGHHLQSTKTTASALLSNEEKLYEDYTWVSCDINPLCHVTVKAILLDHTNHYIFAPLATIFDNVIGFSRSQFITANMISFFHVGVAVAAGKLVSSDSLGYRRLGVILFQFRTFLDDLDGHVARVKKNIRGERSEVGTSGYYIDGLCDGLGCIALLIGMFVYLKNNPPRRGYTQLPMTETKLPEPVAAPKTKLTTRKIAKTVMMFAGQLLMSSTAWNRYIAVYQESLEDNNVSPAVFVRQNIVFRSTWFFSVAWLWRIVNVHSMLHYVLLSIFCDKLWDFLKAIQYSGYVILVVVICFSEMHVLEAHQFICNTVFGST